MGSWHWPFTRAYSGVSVLGRISFKAVACIRQPLPVAPWAGAWPALREREGLNPASLRKVSLAGRTRLAMPGNAKHKPCGTGWPRGRGWQQRRCDRTPLPAAGSNAPPKAQADSHGSLAASVLGSLDWRIRSVAPQEKDIAGHAAQASMPPRPPLLMSPGFM